MSLDQDLNEPVNGDAQSSSHNSPAGDSDDRKKNCVEEYDENGDPIQFGNKRYALKRCNDLHRAMLDCNKSRTMFNLNICNKESKEFWNCMDYYLDNKRDWKDFVPESIAKADDSFRNLLSSIFHVPDSDQLSKAYPDEAKRVRARVEYMRRKAAAESSEDEGAK